MDHECNPVGPIGPRGSALVTVYCNDPECPHAKHVVPVDAATAKRWSEFVAQQAAAFAAAMVEAG